MTAPLSAAEFLARFHATQPAEIDYRSTSDLYNLLELDELAAQFVPEFTADKVRGQAVSVVSHE